ncbi:hypothetical protein C8Q77DRAFT_1259406 [Trametes polyzona]|nr:hypothetical protein C8Q77DRAFT_1259406 [Trametes polyzona]
MLHKTASASSPPKTRLSANSAQSQHLDLDQEVLFRKNKEHVYTSRRTTLSRLDVWLSGFAPATVRPWLLSLPTLSTSVLLYGVLSLLTFSVYLFSGFWTTAPSLVSPLDVSVLSSLPLDHLMEKVTSLRPAPRLSVNVLSTPLDKPLLSAALWTAEAEVEHIESWAADWRGPFSLVITTTAAPSSAQHANLVTQLNAIQRKHPPLKKTLFAHILHLESATDPHPNAFLNLARFLAPSARVALFPSNLSSIPPKTLYRTLLHQQPTSSSAVTPDGRKRKRRPAVLTEQDRTSFPFAPLAPLVLARDDATWCSERFFAGMSRTANWEECLWQVWLANFGDLEVRPVPGLSTGRGDDVDDVMTVCHCRTPSAETSANTMVRLRRSSTAGSSRSSEARHAGWLSGGLQPCATPTAARIQRRLVGSNVSVAAILRTRRGTPNLTVCSWLSFSVSTYHEPPYDVCERIPQYNTRI